MSKKKFTIPLDIERYNNQFKVIVNGFSDEEKSVFLHHEKDISKQEIITTSLNEFVFDLELEDVHPIFTVKISGKEYNLGERTLQIDGMNNFRDMGGYETTDNRFVKWGLLYRSDHIHNATSFGVKKLTKLRIRTIIDYRSDDERSKYPNKIINENVNIYCLDPDAHTAELAAQFTSNKENEDENLVKKIIDQKEKGALINRYDIVMDQYRNFVHKDECKRAFSDMIKIAAQESSSPIVQHCRGGKDRTGYGCMLLLGLLGVKKEYIIYDYMLTHYNRIERNGIKMEKYKKFTQDEQVLDYLYSLIDTQPEFIEASYDAIINKYGSFDNYAIKELGITKEEIARLKEMYLM